MDMLSKYFQQLGFSGELLHAVTGSFHLQHFEKNEFFAAEGKTSRHIGIIESGLFQYFVNKDGQEITSYVSTAGTWLASVKSFISQQPAKENIRSLTAGAVFLISNEDLRKLVNNLPAFKDFYIALLEQSLCGIDESRHDLITLTADQRYTKLLQNEPHLLQLIPLQHLASMLGITPRHLSRIRKNIR